jgi:hypothetical protein
MDLAATGFDGDTLHAVAELTRLGRPLIVVGDRSAWDRLTVVLDEGKTSHGWADSEAEGWEYVKEAVDRPYRGTRYRGPRGLWTLPPA